MTFNDALAMFVRERPEIGPRQIAQVFHGLVSSEKTYNGWRGRVDAYYLNVPLPDPDPIAPEVEDELSAQCPRCKADIGGWIVSSLPRDDLYLNFGVPSFDFRCPGCGTDLEMWIHSYLNKLMAVFNVVHGGIVERDKAALRLVRFYRSVQQVLVDLHQQEPEVYNVLAHMVGLKGVSITQKQVIIELGLGSDSVLRKLMGKATTFLRRHPQMQAAFRYRDLSDEAINAFVASAQGRQEEALAELAAQVATLSTMINEVANHQHDAIFNLRVEVLLLRGLPLAEAQILALLTVEDLALTPSLRRSLNIAPVLTEMRNAAGRVFAGNLLIWLRSKDREQVIKSIPRMGPSGMASIEGAFLLLGIQVYP